MNWIGLLVFDADRGLQWQHCICSMNAKKTKLKETDEIRSKKQWWLCKRIQHCGSQNMKYQIFNKERRLMKETRWIERKHISNEEGRMEGAIQIMECEL